MKWNQGPDLVDSYFIEGSIVNYAETEVVNRANIVSEDNSYLTFLG